MTCHSIDITEAHASAFIVTEIKTRCSELNDIIFINFPSCKLELIYVNFITSWNSSLFVSILQILNGRRFDCMSLYARNSQRPIRFRRYKNISQPPPFLFQQSQLVHRSSFSDFTFRSMFCPLGHSTSDGREMGTGIKGERYKKLLLHTESRDGTARPPTSIVRHAPFRMHGRSFICVRFVRLATRSIRGFQSTLWQKAKTSILH